MSGARKFYYPRKAVAKSAPKRQRKPRVTQVPRPMSLALRGRGEYTYSRPGPWGKYGRKIGEMFGGPAGGAIGSLAHYIGKLFGSGDYTGPAVKNNVLVNPGEVPQFASSKEAVMITHREYIADVIVSSSGSTFQLSSYPINPGLSASFPWLSQLASNFEQYRFFGLVYEFKSLSADALNSVNTGLGSVILGTEYNAANANFNNKMQMENTEYSNSAKPSVCQMHGIECAPNQTSISEMYVRTGAVPSGQSQQLYDLGNFQIATVGLPNNAIETVGELWVTYNVGLYKPILTGGEEGDDVLSAHYQIGNITNTNVFGSVGSRLKQFDNIGLTLTSTGTMTFPNSISTGQFMVAFSVVGAGSAAVSATASDVSNCTVQSYWTSQSGPDTNPQSAGGGTTTNYTLVFVIAVTGSGPVLSIGSATLPTTTPDGDIFVTQLNALVVT